ncbi:ANTAR domain-containing protein [Mycolicibacterium obuense]|uniref:ANTAR domain-containing protein n=2 Tax=Mycolicibacterium obuense TaxID=1807 RepID=A0A4R5X1C3_9MYCO|nr:ANTAR domain-containing protein [Mycolicibacterium obuense]
MAARTGTTPRRAVGAAGVTFREHLLAAVDGHRGSDAADRLCAACVMLFDIDAAAISLVFDGAATGTLGSSGSDARSFDELQFTLGEGPCLESVAQCSPVIVTDLADPAEQRWPVYGRAMLDLRIRGVYAMPVVVAGEYVGALDLFRALPGQLSGEQLAGAISAAELAGIPVLDLLDADMNAAVNDPDSSAWSEMNALTRAEVSQATGMLVAQLGIDPAEALLRLRAHAYAVGRPATDVARDILERRLRLP